MSLGGVHSDIVWSAYGGMDDEAICNSLICIKARLLLPPSAWSH